MTPNLRAALFALLAFAIFAGHDVVVKLLGALYSPVQIVFFGALFAFPLATLMMLRDKTHGTLIPVHPWWLALRTGAAVLTALSAFYAFSVLPLAQVYAIIFATPLFITLLSVPLLGERVGPHRAGAVISGLAGVLVVLRPGTEALTLGHLAALCTAGCGALASVIVRKVGRDERPVVLLLLPMMANVILMGAMLGFVYKPMPAGHLGMLAVIAVLSWFAGRLMVAAYSSGEAAVVAPMQYSQILWASAYGWLIFDERIDRWTAIGAGIIIASGVYIVWREGRGGHSVNRPVLRARPRPETGTNPRSISSILRGIDGRRP
ncbi:MAG: EamA family transporter [Rhodobacterales bacterium]|nr:MAG: EamA family transporter [Rhodobacterales bacterium]